MMAKNDPKSLLKVAEIMLNIEERLEQLGKDVAGFQEIIPPDHIGDTAGVVVASACSHIGAIDPDYAHEFSKTMGYILRCVYLAGYKRGKEEA